MRQFVLAAALAVFGFGVGATQDLLINEIGFTDIGGNDAISSLYQTRDSSDNPLLQVRLTTSDTVAYTFDNTQMTFLDSNSACFGTSQGESCIASNGTDTTWTVSSGDLVLGTDAFLTRIEGGMQLGAVSTFGDVDETPDVSGNTYWNTFTGTATVTDFDGSGIEAGQLLFIVSTGAVTFDCTSSGLSCGSTDIVTADGDLIAFLYDGVDWIMISFMDNSDNQA